MRGDRLIIGPEHRRAAARITELLRSRLTDSPTPWGISISGESGSGKSELAETLREAWETAGIPAVILPQDDYFVHPPITNDRLRREDIRRVGPQEVHLDLLDEAVRGIVMGEARIEKPLVDYKADQIGTEWIKTGRVKAVIAEGTYTWSLPSIDIHIFIDRDFRTTRKKRRLRNRDRQDSFLEQVLEIEHDIIAPQRPSAHLLVTKDFDVRVQNDPAREKTSQGEVMRDG